MRTRPTRPLMTSMIYHLLSLLLALSLAACDGSDSSPNDTATGTGDDTGTSTALSANETLFPATITLTSPLATSGTAGPASLITATQVSRRTDYDAQIDAVAEILNGTDPLNCGFQPEQFFNTAVNARCYGPSLPYRNHPNATDAAMFDGVLPGGDVGLWLETEVNAEGDSTGEACAAAQLNQRMRDLTLRGVNALQVTASMKCVTNFNASLTFPNAATENTSVDVVTAMNTMAVIRGLQVAFTEATIAFSQDDETGENVYTYTLTFVYDADGDGVFSADENAKPIDIILVHRADADGGTYRGRLSYTFNDDTQVNEGNCFGLSGSTNVTRAGSFLYTKSDTTVHVDGRFATFCGYGADALSSGLVDPTKVYSVTNTTGWTDNFNWFTALFNPDQMAGDYAFAWQAGFGDGNTRVFNLHLAQGEAGRSGTAFFGFGADMTATDGGIQGMICNWAGPNHQHFPLTLAVQKQEIAESIALGGLFVPSSSAIGYAPINGCRYDAATDNVNGDYVVDLDADGDLADETHRSIANALQSIDADSDGTADDTDANGIIDIFEDAGFGRPGSPVNFN